MGDNEDLLFVAEEWEPAPSSLPAAGPWKIMIVDNEEAVHTVTRLALKRLVFDRRPVRFLSAYTAADVHRLLREHPDTAVILLDVVMEEEDTGLKLAHWIRKEEGNFLARIILRTGHPGQAPEQSVIIDYDINDYREKAELTAQKLHTSVVTALRSYRDLAEIDRNRRGLQDIIASSATIFELQSVGKFAVAVLEKISALLAREDQVLTGGISVFACTKNGVDTLEVLAATGRSGPLTGRKLKDVVTPEVWSVIRNSFEKKASLFFPGYFVTYSQGKRGYENVVFMECARPLSEWERNMLAILNLNIAVSLDNISLTQEVEDTQKEIIFTLGEIAEARSQETGFHVKRVAELSKLLALKCGLPSHEAELLHIAAPTHDLGKLAIADHILKKPGKLTGEEFAVMKNHTEIGYEMLCRSEHAIMKSAALIALEHHEHWDGNGYPRALKGEEIHIYGRIVGLTDVFDALGNQRVYKKAWPLEDIVAYIRSQRGKQFDPRLVDIFLENLDEILEIRRAFPDR